MFVVTANLTDLNLSTNYSLCHDLVIYIYQYNLRSVKEAAKIICKWQQQNSVLKRTTDEVTESNPPFQEMLEVCSIFSIISDVFSLNTEQMLTWVGGHDRAALLKQI